MTGEFPRTRVWVAFRFSASATLSLTLALLLCGCLPSEEPGAVERVGVWGEVSLDGKPLKAAAIVFEHHFRDGEAAILAHGFVQEGLYRIDAVQGPAVGRCRVRFLPKPLDREEYEAKLDEAAERRLAAAPTIVSIPETYGEDSTLEVNVVGDKENRLDFQLVSEP